MPARWAPVGTRDVPVPGGPLEGDTQQALRWTGAGAGGLGEPPALSWQLKP